MNRSDLQALDELRIQEADVLLQNSRYEGAYHLAGYAVECALKACIAKQIREHDFPDKKLIVDSYTHDLTRLLSLSGLAAAFQQATTTDADLEANWAVVKDWTEQYRYALSVERTKAEDLFRAITDNRSGILTWLKIWW